MSKELSDNNKNNNKNKNKKYHNSQDTQCERLKTKRMTVKIRNDTFQRYDVALIK